uniref:uncharacterized protein LOC118549540 n=1 Tax=Halichoerus grypus TaxID=9711 RepID=UPI0016591C4F|nr:uncharacterized protein LOC118549540 [Halichoerus grypus]
MTNELYGLGFFKRCDRTLGTWGCHDGYMNEPSCALVPRTICRRLLAEQKGSCSCFEAMKLFWIKFGDILMTKSSTLSVGEEDQMHEDCMIRTRSLSVFRTRTEGHSRCLKWTSREDSSIVPILQTVNILILRTLLSSQGVFANRERAYGLSPGKAVPPGKKASPESPWAPEGKWPAPLGRRQPRICGHKETHKTGHLSLPSEYSSMEIRGMDCMGSSYHIPSTVLR